MTLKNKILITLGLLVAAISLVIPSVHAADQEYYDRIANADSKAATQGIACASEFWMTSNIDPYKAMEFLKTYIIWNNEFPLRDDPDNDDIKLDYEIKEDIYGYTITTYFKAGIGQNQYGRFSRIKIVESKYGAEYMIGRTNKDAYSIVVDGSTYKNDLGILLNDAIAQQESYYENTDFKIPYASACDIYENVLYAALFVDTDSKDHLAVGTAKVGFNLTKDSYVPDKLPTADDDYIYGGDENNKLDDTPTEKPIVNNTKFNLGKAVGITLSVLSGIVILYVIYYLGTKIYELIKEK